MTRFTDAALLKGDFASLLKNPPQEAEWNNTACDFGAEQVAQTIGKQIFELRQHMDPENEKLEIITFSSTGYMKVIGITPLEGELIRIDGLEPESGEPVVVIHHIEQISLTFRKVLLQDTANMSDPDDDDGLKIGFVIFDELTERKKKRDAEKQNDSSSE